MPKVSAKRQITLPIDQCREAGIEPGDDYESYVANDGQITIIKKNTRSRTRHLGSFNAGPIPE